MRGGASAAAGALWAAAVAALVAAAVAQDAPPPDPAPDMVEAAAAGYELPIVDAQTNRGLRPTRLEAYGQTHYYQLAEDPVGTLVWFHGCARPAKGFFPYDPKYCSECIGLPEDVSHTKQALARGYALLALDPNSRDLCWSSSAKGSYVNDQPDVIATVSQFLRDQGLEGKPLFFAGASSGGTIALKLPPTLFAQNSRLRVDGIIAEVSSGGGTPADFGAADSQGRLKWPDYPPTFFVTMERDTGGQREAQGIADFFNSKGIPSAMVVSPKRTVAPTYFSDRSPVISPEQSTRIVAALKDIGLVDREGQLQGNPHDYNKVQTSKAWKWPTKLKQALPWLGTGPLDLTLRNGHIFQALGVAYAGHEHVSDYMTVGLAFLESRGRPGLQTLLKQYTPIAAATKAGPATPRATKPFAAAAKACPATAQAAKPIPTSTKPCSATAQAAKPQPAASAPTTTTAQAAGSIGIGKPAPATPSTGCTIPLAASSCEPNAAKALATAQPCAAKAHAAAQPFAAKALAATQSLPSITATQVVASSAPKALPTAAAAQPFSSATTAESFTIPSSPRPLTFATTPQPLAANSLPTAGTTPLISSQPLAASSQPLAAPAIAISSQPVSTAASSASLATAGTWESYALAAAAACCTALAAATRDWGCCPTFFTSTTSFQPSPTQPLAASQPDATTPELTFTLALHGASGPVPLGPDEQAYVVQAVQQAAMDLGASQPPNVKFVQPLEVAAQAAGSPPPPDSPQLW
ncbi:hypothetical protein ABPG75_005248 [Micractinium tetrahymenae]